MANEPDDRGTTSGRVTPKGGPATQPPATKAAARKAAAAAASRKADEKSRPAPRKVERNADGTIEIPAKVDPKAEAKGDAAKGATKPTKVDPKAAARSGNPKKKAAATAESSRYTPPVPSAYKVSPWWIPALMFTFLGLGALIIILNYINWPFGEPSNWRLLAGLGSILAGILVATRYQ